MSKIAEASFGDNLWTPRIIPDFDGETYVRNLDHKRLSKQHIRVFLVMSDMQWHTLTAISAITDDPPASVSARLRDFRKAKFGGKIIERRRAGNGLFEYRLAS